MFLFKKFIAEKAKGKDAVPGVKGRQDPSYFKDLDKDTKVSRAKAINRQKDMSDDDPSAIRNYLEMTRLKLNLVNILRKL